jgi:hypothetical protein
MFPRAIVPFCKIFHFKTPKGPFQRIVLDSIIISKLLMILVLHQDLAIRQEFYYPLFGFRVIRKCICATTSTGYEFELLFFGQS